MFNIDVATLEDQRAELPLPAVVPRRVLHIDADFLAYQVSSHTEHSFAEMQKSIVEKATTLRILAGAEVFVLHITDSNSTKGGRYDTAIQKEYQGNRKDKPKPPALEQVKKFMLDIGAINHKDQEADDGLCQALYNAPDRDLVVLYSLDKDLRMCSGIHLQDDTFDLVDVNGFGSTFVDETKSVPTIGGFGTKLFWTQMLLGDRADNIQGLPVLHPDIANIYSERRCNKPTMVGTKMAFNILKDIKNDYDAFVVVRDLYKHTGETYGFKHWRTAEDANWREVFLSEAELMWIRRSTDRMDFYKFLKQIRGI